MQIGFPIVDQTTAPNRSSLSADGEIRRVDLLKEGFKSRGSAQNAVIGHQGKTVLPEQA